MRRLRFLAVAAAIAVMVGQPQVVLANGSSGGSGGSSGGYAAASVSYGSGGGHVGPLRRLMAKIRDHRAARFSASSSTGGSSGGSTGTGHSSGGASYASSGSSGGASYVSSGSSGGASYASSGSSGGSTSAYGSNGGSTGGYASASTSYDVPISSVSLGGSSIGYESPAVSTSYETSYPATSGETIMSDSVISDGGTVIDTVPTDSFQSSRYESARPSSETDEAILNVIVPEGAVVTVNDHETESEGETRKFMSRGLKKGYVYTYVVKATYDRDGEPKTETKSVKLRPGDVELVSFQDSNVSEDSTDVVAKSTKADENLVGKSTDDGEPEDVVTVVRLTVPATAEVTLAGNPTAGGGRIRTFRTKQLKAGQKWTDYTVAVTVVVDGTPVTKTKTIDVDAGSTNEIVFEFDENTLASR
jgi:uncharacterized protein (TIGR03000 family)